MLKKENNMKKTLLSLFFVLTLLLSLAAGVYAYSDEGSFFGSYDESTGYLGWKDANIYAIVSGAKPSSFEYAYGEEHGITKVYFDCPVTVTLYNSNALLVSIMSEDNSAAPINVTQMNSQSAPATLGAGDYMFVLSYGEYGDYMYIHVGNGEQQAPKPEAPADEAENEKTWVERADFYPLASAFPKSIQMSDWAKDELFSALNSFIIPADLLKEGTDYKRPVTRKEFASIMTGVRSNIFGDFDVFTGNIDDGSYGMKFTDLGKDYCVYYSQYHGIVNGLTETQFSPDGLLTREQGAAMLYRVYGSVSADPAFTAPNIENTKKSFSDASQFSDWAKDAINNVSAYDCGSGVYVMGGVGENTFDPKGTMTVEQALVAAHRMYKFLWSCFGA